jgi:rhodanese-related sulfurtransferase
MIERELPLELDVVATKHLLDRGEIVLIDCREPDEYEIACVSESVLMPMSQWESAVERLESIASRRLVVMCHHGIRSLRVTHWLRQNGFPDAQSMSGGIAAWSSTIDPSVPHY